MDTITIKRLQEDKIHADLDKKMVFIVGPRQVGKTWLSKKIAKRYQNSIYLNYDLQEDREVIQRKSWPLNTDLIVFDELHKMKGWKNYLKGVYDTREGGVRILVTGSARMEAFRKTGDSLAGRYFVHHLFPFSLSELQDTPFSTSLDRLIERGGFPEPFLAESKEDADRWRKQYSDSLIREDSLTLEEISDMKTLYDVFEILRRSVSSQISYASIGQSLGISPVTVKRYIGILESLYIIFKIKTFSKKISRSILKETKIFFYDTGLVVGDVGAVLENTVAVSLLKQITYTNDTKGKSDTLMYLRTKDRREVDFVIVDSNNTPTHMIEVKTSDILVSKHLIYFKEKYGIKGTQIVKNMHQKSLHSNGIDIERASEYLGELGGGKK